MKNDEAEKIINDAEVYYRPIMGALGTKAPPGEHTEYASRMMGLSYAIADTLQIFQRHMAIDSDKSLELMLNMIRDRLKYNADIIDLK